MRVQNIHSELKKCISEITDCTLTEFNLACEMMMFDFGQYIIHSSCLTRIVKNNDILFTTLDYQTWDGENCRNNDEWFFKDKFCDQIVGGRVVSAEINQLNDVKIQLDNGVLIEIFIANGYNHYDDETEQFRLIKKNPDYRQNIDDRSEFSVFHIVVNSKTIEKEE
ncbi:MAG: hypothetical protein K2K91_07870 [Ruminococcus sp.]|nr:hypothetical protein [Ruminococcus sp.]